MTLERLELGDRGRRFVEEWLDAGQTLGRLLRPVAMGHGHVYAFVPVPADRFREHNLSHGGLFVRNIPVGLQMEAIQNLDTVLARLTFSHVHADSTHCALFENFLASATDPWLRSAALAPFTVGDEVYFGVGPGRALEAEIRAAIDEAKTASGYLGCWSRLGNDEQQLSGELRLEAVARNATEIVSAAFDGEGFVVWSSTGRLPERLDV